MFIFHATVRTNPGQASAYAERTVGASQAITQAPGFVRRILLRDLEHDDVFFYISMWQTEAQLQAYRNTEFVAEMRERASLIVLTQSVSRVACELLVDEESESIDHAGRVSRDLDAPDTFD